MSNFIVVKDKILYWTERDFFKEYEDFVLDNHRFILTEFAGKTVVTDIKTKRIILTDSWLFFEMEPEESHRQATLYLQLRHKYQSKLVKRKAKRTLILCPSLLGIHLDAGIHKNIMREIYSSLD